jgi:hypothetical protein
MAAKAEFTNSIEAVIKKRRKTALFIDFMAQSPFINY